MGYLIHKPSSILAPYIKQYWMIENVLEPGSSYVQRIIPAGLMELNFFFSTLPKTTSNNDVYDSGAVISGQQSGYFDLEIKDSISMFSVTFQPAGARQFFKIPMFELLNNTASLEVLNKAIFKDLEDKLGNATSFEERIGLIEKYFIHELSKNPGYNEDDRIIDSIAFITRSKGICDLDILSSRACLSTKQYVRLFKKVVGIQPKKFLRVVRFQHMLFMNQHSRDLLTSFAYEGGYFDQSHMIRDFKEFAGLSPRKLLFGENPGYSDYFN